MTAVEADLEKDKSQRRRIVAQLIQANVLLIWIAFRRIIVCAWPGQFVKSVAHVLSNGDMWYVYFRFYKR